MPNPQTDIDCPKGEWKEVATNVIGGQIIPHDTGADYYATYRVQPVVTPPNAIDNPPETEGQRFSGPTPIYTKEGEIHTIYVFCKRNAGTVEMNV